MAAKPKHEPVSSAVKPPALRKGARVGVVCPASRPESPKAVARALALLTESGYAPTLGEHCLDCHGFYAGSDEKRAADFNKFLADDVIEAVFCLAGGYGSAHLLPRIDYAALARRPKIIVGGEDNSALLSGINARTGMVVFHGPNLEEIKDGESARRLFAVLSSTSVPEPLACVQAAAAGGLAALSGLPYAPVGGTVSGELVGGNLTALVSLFGTEYQPAFAGKVLLLDDVNERTDILDRWFTTLYVSGRLSEAKGVCFGQFHDCGPRGNYNVLSIEELFGDRLKELSKPSCFGFPFGFSGGEATATVPIGIAVTAHMERGVIEYAESAVV